LAAIHGKVDFLLTGDGHHFGHLYGKRIEGVMVLRPAQVSRPAHGGKRAGVRQISINDGPRNGPYRPG
jgi:hypothetical protein